MSVIGAIMVPHPPIILPEVGRGEEAAIRKTTNSYKEAARFLKELAPDTIVLSSPHQVMYQDYFNIASGSGAKGSMSQFRAGSVKFQVDYDQPFIRELCALAEDAGLPAGTLGQRDPDLDHGAMVPLYFIRKAYPEFRLVRLGLSGLSYEDHYRLGQMVREAAEHLDRRVVFVGSGDLSHKLKEDGPYGFVEEGPEYDDRIMDVMGRAAFDELFDFSESFCDRAAECGHRSFLIMAGALDGKAVNAKQLSHEGTFGVGYGICTYAVTGPDPSRRFLGTAEERKRTRRAELRNAEDIYIKLARKTIETFIRDHKIISLYSDLSDIAPDGLPAELTERQAGTFVSLHKNGNLRGCIGTIQATRTCVADEIISNAVSAATRDPRFAPVGLHELEDLDISVDVLGPTERISSPAELDVKRYGVVVTKGRRRGLLLPNLEGVDSIDEQICIAKQKAGLDPDEENVTLERFEVVRHECLL